MIAKYWLVVPACLMFSAPVRAQSPSRSSSAGVYSQEQVSRGQDVYVLQCRSCHTPEAHASPTFQAVWGGKSLHELYSYIRERMPKNDPATLSDQEYVDVLTYLLRLNRAPIGTTELPADADTLKGIRFDPKPLAVRKDP
jgi:mono/diheme cytochrome c family protein